MSNIELWLAENTDIHTSGALPGGLVLMPVIPAQDVVEVGLSIALEECERRLTALTQRATIRHKHRAPDYFAYRPAPVRVSQEAAPLLVGGYRTHPSVEAGLYDFGAVSITYRIPLQGAFSTLLEMRALDEQ